MRASDPDGRTEEVRATQVVLATGGAGQLYSVTTNPKEATGDGIAMALRAGVAVADVEFFQFHPTALHHPAMPRPLLSEALRGHGALLRDAEGERFVDELAPRDVVSRAMAQRMSAQGAEHLWLDATGLDAFGERFPTVAASLHEVDLDPAVDWLPIAPAAHYVSGGVVTDLDGASGLPGLWVAGEAACTGVHGANRLASNSLLEGMVFGARAAEAIEAGRDGPVATGVMGAVLALDGGRGAGTGTAPSDTASHDTASHDTASHDIACTDMADLGPPAWDGRETAPGGAGAETDVGKLRELLQRAMTGGAGVVRSPQSLAAAAATVADVASALPALEPGHGTGELANLVTLADALLRSAAARHETRGAHVRVDHPVTRPEWRRRLLHRPAPGPVAAGAARP